MRPGTPDYRLILGLLTVGLLIGAALTDGPAEAASGPGPFYAEPAWDQKLGCLTIANCPRFLVLTNWLNEAVLDKETGLVWEHSPALTTHTWSEARVQCTGRTTGNRKGWRLPSIHELASLVHPFGFTPGGPTLVPGHPFTDVQPNSYWSATTNADNSASAWGVTFGSGFVGNGLKSGNSRAWCVRGGMNAEAY